MKGETWRKVQAIQHRDGAADWLELFDASSGRWRAYWPQEASKIIVIWLLFIGSLLGFLWGMLCGWLKWGIK